MSAQYAALPAVRHNIWKPILPCINLRAECSSPPCKAAVWPGSVDRVHDLPPWTCIVSRRAGVVRGLELPAQPLSRDRTHGWLCPGGWTEVPASLSWQAGAVGVGFVPMTAGTLQIFCALGGSLLLNATSGGTARPGGCSNLPQLWSSPSLRGCHSFGAANCRSSTQRLSVHVRVVQDVNTSYLAGSAPQGEVVAGAPATARLLRPPLPLQLSRAAATFFYFEVQVGPHHHMDMQRLSCCVSTRSCIRHRMCGLTLMVEAAQTVASCYRPVQDAAGNVVHGAPARLLSAALQPATAATAVHRVTPRMWRLAVAPVLLPALAPLPYMLPAAAPASADPAPAPVQVSRAAVQPEGRRYKLALTGDHSRVSV